MIHQAIALNMSWNFFRTFAVDFKKIPGLDAREED